MDFYFILPLMPIIIGAAIVFTALFSKVAPIFGPIGMVFRIISCVVFGVIMFFGFVPRKTSWFDRIVCIALSLVSGGLGLIISNNFFASFASSSSDLAGLFDTLILVSLGGILWVLMAGGCLGACLIVYDEEDPLRHFKSVGLIIAVFAVAKIFNFI